MIHTRLAKKTDLWPLVKLFDEFYSKFNMAQILKGTTKDLLEVDNQEKFARDTIRDYLDGNYIIYVAEESSHLVGYICGLIHVRNHYKYSPEAEIIDWFVTEKLRNKGIGKELYNTFYEEITKRSCRSISLESFYTNINAVGIYEKMGFIKDSLILKKIIQD